MKIHSVIEGTRVNGPGFRLGVWVQGCLRHCPGCFNAESCRMDGGRDVSVDALVRLALRHQYDGISVSGGEPFYQSEELAQLLEECRLHGLDTLVYTGYTYEELSAASNQALRHCDYLIDGEYRREIPSRCRWAGSGNQRFLRLQDGKLVADLTGFHDSAADGEIFIGPDGTITLTGFINI